MIAGIVKLAVCFGASLAVFIFAGPLWGLGAGVVLGYMAGTVK